MASKRLMGVGNFIMKSRDNSSNNISNILDKSVNTNSTYETPKRPNSRLVLNPLYSNKKEQIIFKRLPTESKYNSISNNISKLTEERLKKSKILNIPYLQTEQRKESSNELLNHADKIVKDRTKNNLMLNMLVKSAILDKTKKINLENYKIKLIHNRQKELNTKVFEISRALQLSEKNFEKDYKSFLSLVDKNNVAQKKQDAYISKLSKQF